ncbi:MAG: SpoIVB peptidase S55 domain-containing protein [Polyangiaceae bacterium]
MRFDQVLLASAFAALLAPLPLLGVAQADGLTSRPDILPVSAIKPGMKGYGLTVFEGTKPEKFDVEVIDVLKNFQPRQELILIKTKHPRLEVAKVVAGMSGSPIYINNKMIGAYAYGWTFGKEPVAGVTPIRSMLDDLVRPIPKTIGGWPLAALPAGKAKVARRAASGSQRFSGLADDYDLRKHGGQLAKRRAVHLPGKDSPVAPVATPLLLGGISTGAVGFARDLLAPLGLEPLQAGGGGGTEAGAPTRYVDGGAVGVQLIRGDMSAMGLGTVTRVEGDKLVAFGHPMMQSGVTALPTAIGRVLWFLASDMRSFKIGMPVRDVGALINDRLASIVVSHSAKAPTVPVSLKIKGVTGAPFNTWNFEIAHEKFMTPAFMAIALGSALQATASERQDVTWTATSKLTVKGYGTVKLEDYGVAIGGTPDPNDFVRSSLVRAVGGIMNNPWQDAFVERAEMEIELHYAREMVRLRGAEALESEVEAGRPARIRLTLTPYAGKEITRVISVPIPKHLAGQKVTLEIGPGYQERKERADAENLGELIRNLEDATYPIKSVVVAYATGDGAVSYKGRVAKNLPPGALDTLRPTTASVAPESFKNEARHAVSLGQFMVGTDRVQIDVKPVLR